MERNVRINESYDPRKEEFSNDSNLQAFANGLNLGAAKQDTVLTENGATVYATTGTARTDFFARATEFRNKPAQEVAEALSKAFNEDPIDAVVLAFQLGDIREGKGERTSFKACLSWLGNEHPEIMKELLPHVAEYSRWDYATELIMSRNSDTASAATNLVVNQLKEDLCALKKGEAVSLLAKWLPSVQSKKPEQRKLAHKIMNATKMDFKHYRKTLGALRDRLNVIERYMSQNYLEELNQESMTSKQQLKYDDMLMRKIPEARTNYLRDVLEGKANMNASVLNPHEIVYDYHKSCLSNRYYDSESIPSTRPVLELLWKKLPDKVQGNGTTLVIRDGSGSMTCPINKKTSCSMLDVATALSIYCAEKLTGPLKDKFITFSSHPKVVDLSNANTLREKLNTCYKYNDCTNTNIKKTFDMLLDIATANKLTQEQIPKYLLIASDMEFDYALSDSIHTKTYEYRTRNLPDKNTLFDTIKAEWNAAGYEVPTLVFWQLNNERTLYPEIDSKNGIIYLSGFSTNTLDMVMEGKFEVEQKKEMDNGEIVTEKRVMTPYEQMKAIVSQKRYEPIVQAVERGLEAEKKRDDWYRDIVTQTANGLPTHREQGPRERNMAEDLLLSEL